MRLAMFGSDPRFALLRRALTVLAVAMLVVVAAPAEAGKKGKKKKKKGDEPPPVGWVEYEKGACYNPPNFADFAAGPKRMAWQDTRNAIVGQWRGERNDGIQFDSKRVEAFETVLLSEPERIERVAKSNFDQCTAAMQSGNPSKWAQWMIDMPGELTAGECPHPPLDSTLQYYLEIRTDWDLAARVCRGDRVIIDATEADYYRITKDGPWINAAGDPEGTDVDGFPCERSDCLRGQLIMRFQTESGIDEISPVGLEKTFLAPDHGTITLMINDNEVVDNEFKVESGVEHHTGIQYKPAGG
ncbi:MAG: hypothetical protein AAGA48_18610 [Myxococcota bacterium]